MVPPTVGLLHVEPNIISYDLFLEGVIVVMATLCDIKSSSVGLPKVLVPSSVDLPGPGMYSTSKT